MRPGPFRLERFFAEFEFDVPYLLGSSDCEAITVDELLALEDRARERLLGLRLSYRECRGDPELKRAIAGLYDGLDQDNVVAHTASMEALFVLMNAALEAGDRVVVQAPYFQPLAEIARAIGCSVATWDGREEDGWRPDLGALERLLETPTRLLVVNFPHNPTGYLPSRDELVALVDLARDRGVRVFCDEIFRLMEHEPERRLPAVCELDERAVSLGGVSKVLGLPGLRTGWLASRDRELLDRVIGIKDYTTTCAPGPSEQLAALALRNRERLLEANRARVTSNLELFAAFVERRSDLVAWVRPGAGTVAFPRWRLAERMGEPVESLCRELARQAGVLMIPGSMFDRPEHTRVGFGRAGFREGLERLEGFLEQRSR